MSRGWGKALLSGAFHRRAPSLEKQALFIPVINDILNILYRAFFKVSRNYEGSYGGQPGGGSQSSRKDSRSSAMGIARRRKCSLSQIMSFCILFYGYTPREPSARVRSPAPVPYIILKSKLKSGIYKHFSHFPVKTPVTSHTVRRPYGMPPRREFALLLSYDLNITFQGFL